MGKYDGEILTCDICGSSAPDNEETMMAWAFEVWCGTRHIGIACSACVEFLTYDSETMTWSV